MNKAVAYFCPDKDILRLTSQRLAYAKIPYTVHPYEDAWVIYVSLAYREAAEEALK